jgi:Tol biopolymer transport system component
MLKSRIRPDRSDYLAVPLFLVLIVILSSSLQAIAQEESAAGGEITFVRLANGEPGGEGIYIVNADGTNERPLFLFEDIGLPYDLNNGGYRCPVWSPEGAQLALNGSEGESTYIAVVNVDDGTVQRVYETEHDDQILRNTFFPEWVPGEDSQLSFGFTEVERNTGVLRASGVRVVSLDDGEVTTLTDSVEVTEPDGSPRYMGGPVPNYNPFSHSWSPDGIQLALALYNWRIHLLNADGTAQREIPAQWANGDVEWSPDGTALAVSLYRMILVDPQDDTERELVPFGETLNGSTVESLAWSPDGSEIAYATMLIDLSTGEFTTAFTISVIDVETGEIRELLRTPAFTGSEFPHNISCVDWRPAGE